MTCNYEGKPDINGTELANSRCLIISQGVGKIEN